MKVRLILAELNEKSIGARREERLGFFGGTPERAYSAQKRLLRRREKREKPVLFQKRCVTPACMPVT